MKHASQGHTNRMQTQSHWHEQEVSTTLMESPKMGIIAKKWKSGFLKMKLVAEILTGSLFYVEVEEDATVGDLKREIAKQENLPGDRLILLLDAEEHGHYALDIDEASLKDYGVADSSHIYIFFQPQDSIASTPKDSASNEPSHSMDSANGPPNEAELDEDEAPHEDNASSGAPQPSTSVDQEE